MSETPVIKLHLQALTSNNNHKDQVAVSENSEISSWDLQDNSKTKLNEIEAASTSKDDLNKSKNIISLWMIQKHNSENLKNNWKETSKNLEQQENIVIESKNPQKPPLENEKQNSRDISQDQNNSNNQIIWDTDTKNKTPQQDSKKKIEFTNYVSDFEKESENVFKKIRNFDYSPKTNIVFLLSIVSITILIIGTLMVFFPEKHSLKIYKASILELTHKNRPQKHQIDQKKNGDLSQDIDNAPSSDMSSNINTKKDPASTEIWKEMSQEERQKELIKNHLIKKYTR